MYQNDRKIISTYHSPFLPLPPFFQNQLEKFVVYGDTRELIRLCWGSPSLKDTKLFCFWTVLLNQNTVRAGSFLNDSIISFRDSHLKSESRPPLSHNSTSYLPLLLMDNVTLRKDLITLVSFRPRDLTHIFYSLNRGQEIFTS